MEAGCNLYCCGAFNTESEIQQPKCQKKRGERERERERSILPFDFVGRMV
jgi:hypothetical protein